MKKKLLTILLVCLLSMLFTNSISADETKTLSIYNQNVAGLPIPAIFNDNYKIVSNAQKRIGKVLNSSGYDVVCVQEDFTYHDILSAQMTNYKYKTKTSGSIPYGDGLNIFSKYPIYNVERVAWKQAYGVITAYCDELTPKGFLKVTIDVNGILIDLYDIHMDAGSTEQDMKAKASQYKQMSDYIKKNSTENPVIIVGDFNTELHNDRCGFYETMLSGENKFTDCWSYSNGGEDFRVDKDSKIAKYTSELGSSQSHWDSLERCLFRSSNKVTVDLISGSFKYQPSSDVKDNPYALSDHYASVQKFNIAGVKVQQNLEKQAKESLLSKTTRVVTSIVKDLKLLFTSGR